MLKKVEARCKRCGKEFCKKRTEQEFCSAQCRNAASNPDLGSFVRAQIVAHQDDPNSITFALADGSTGRAWLASDNHGSNLIGDDRLWRNNIEELVRQKERRPKAVSWLPAAQTLRRPIIVVGRNDPVQDVDDGSLVAMTQFKTLTMRLGW
jgi:hypothetical protein